MGVPADVIAQFEDAVEDEDFSIYPENWAAINLFMQLDTNWRNTLIATPAGIVSMRAGIDYTSLESLMRMTGIEDMKDTFWRVRTMELAALEAMSCE